MSSGVSIDIYIYIDVCVDIRTDVHSYRCMSMGASVRVSAHVHILMPVHTPVLMAMRRCLGACMDGSRP